jgi:hypothetical protein
MHNDGEKPSICKTSQTLGLNQALLICEGESERLFSIVLFELLL